MRLHCLGTVGYHPNESRHTSCYFLPESGILLDGGSGLFRMSPLIQTDSIDVLMSHAHLDHIMGLTFLLDVLFQSAERGQKVEHLRIWGEQAKLDAIQNHLFSELIFPVPLSAQWNAIDDLPEFKIGNTEVAWRQQDHPGGSVGYRMTWPEENKTLVYATDTTGDTSAEWAEWAKDADMLMHECYFRDSASDWAKKTGHSWTSRVAELAESTNPAKLLLTHVNPLETLEDPVDIEKIRSRCDGEVILAEDGLELDF